MALLPTIEKKHLHNCTYLNIAGNALSDAAFNLLCVSLKEIHCSTIEKMDISDNKLSDDAIKSLIDVSNSMYSLKEVVTENIPDMSTPMLNRLNIRLKKN
jgi:Ran GTPase-activating protein (RanGAP) involved in mRNA processing and transport